MVDDLRPQPPHSPVRGLLEQITDTSLDEDYAHVARRRGPGRSGGSGGSGGSGRPGALRGSSQRGRPGVVALVVLAVFGVLVATAAVQTRRDAGQTASSRESLVKQADAAKVELADRRSQTRSLLRQITAQRSAALSETTEGQALQFRLTELGVATGARSVSGPGIAVRVDDAPDARSSQDQVQAPDLQKLVNSLWAIGAEAIAINDYRVTALTSIRDAAGAITVNFTSLRRPYVVEAVGDPSTMAARLVDTPGGQALLTLQSSFGLRFDIDDKESMVLPGRSLTLRHARPVPRDRR